VGFALSQTVPVAIVAAVSCGLSILYSAVYLQFGKDFYGVVNQLGPFILFVTCGWAAYELVRRSPIHVWLPVTWFLVSCAGFFGFGPLAFYFGTPESIEYMTHDFPVDEEWLLRTNLLNSVGIGIVTVVYTVAATLIPKRLSVVPFANDISMEKVMWLFLIVGGIAKYLLTLPHALGLIPTIVPGSLQHLSMLVTTAIILLTILIHQGRRDYQWLICLVVGSEIVTGLMMFNKSEVITTILAVLLGRSVYQANIRSLIGSGLIVAILYMSVLSPFVSFARVAFGGLGVTSVAEFQDTVEEYHRVGNDALAMLQPGVQSWWTRLNYASVQSFAMYSFDMGGAGETLSLLPYVLLPRIFFEDKPLMTSGKDLTRLITGDESLGHTGLGIFGEAYWDGGWEMVVLVCSYVGVLFALYGEFSTTTIMKRHFAYMPIVLIGVIMGLHPEDWFVPTFVGSVIEAFCLYVVLKATFSICRQISAHVLHAEQS
jgi:hypothetical protein